MNVITRWRKNDRQFLPLDLDPDFEEACRQSLQEPMQTPTERLREAQENILIVLRDNVERSYAALSDPSPKTDKRKKARETQPA